MVIESTLTELLTLGGSLALPAVCANRVIDPYTPATSVNLRA